MTILARMRSGVSVTWRIGVLRPFRGKNKTQKIGEKIMSMKKCIAMLLAAIMLLPCCVAPAMAEGAKWSEEVTADGWIKVTNEGGKTLGYSADSGLKLIEVDGYAFKDMNGNGALDAYEDWRLDNDARSQDLAKQMIGLDQAKMFMLLSLSGPETAKKLGTALQTDMDNGIRTFSARGSTIKDTVNVVNLIQSYAESLPFAIPVDLRGDVGNSLASKWPNHLGLAASFDPDLVAEYNALYSSELRDLGLTTAHHPQMDLATEPRWYRFTGTFGEHAVMTSDMGTAATNALQSTYDENGNDLGWGEDSVNALIKHYPGDGQAEGGRESHSFVGKYNVYPGDMFDLAESVYSEALTKLPGQTGVSAGVMTDFSIHLDADGDPIGIDDRVAAAYNAYIQIELLRDKYNWDGIVCTDYSILHMMPWGMEDATIVERVVKTLEAGTDRIENYNVKEDIVAGWEAYADKHGQEAADQRLYESVRRLSRSFFQVGLFDNPYLSMEEANANVASADKVEAGYNAMLRSVIMLKNSDNIIKAATDAKPTVYIPVKADGKACIDIATASEYFTVITDTVGEDGAVVRPAAEELAGVDFALVQINSPKNVTLASGFMARPGYDQENDKWIPLSLQYRSYTADSFAVRTESIGGDMIEPDSTGLYQDDYYGQKAMKVKENRSYFGNTAVISNESDLDLVLDTAALVDKVIVIANASNPFVVNEFESEIDALVMHFGVNIKAVLDIVSGKVEPSALLPMQMPANMETVEEQLEDVPFDMECHEDADGNVYDFGFGLNWSGVIQDERTERYTTDNYEQ